MNSQIKNYDELNNDEHFVMQMFRTMKIEMDKSRFELLSYKINDLLNSYQELQQLRDNIRVSYFSVLEEIDANMLGAVDVNYEKWNELLSNENANWNEESELLGQFKYYLDDLIMQLDDGTMEQLIIEEEKNIDVDC